jgi:hypothetical protein
VIQFSGQNKFTLEKSLTTWGVVYRINRKKFFKQMKDSSKVDSERFGEFRKGVRNELFYIIFKCCYLLYYIFSFSGKVFKARKEKGVLRKTLIEMG